MKRKIRYLLIFILFVSFLQASNIAVEISNKKKEYQSIVKNEKKLYLKLDSVAKDIKLKQKRLLDINSIIKQLDKDLLNESKMEKRLIKKLKVLEEKSKKLNTNKVQLESKMVDLIAKDFSLAIVLGLQGDLNEDAVVSNELLEVLSEVVNKEFFSMKNEYRSIVKQIDNFNKQIKNIKSNIEKLDQKRAKQAKLKKEQSNSIARLKKIKKRYLSEIKRVQDEQKSLNETLKKLNILKKKEDEKAKKLAQKEKERQKRTIDEKISTLDDEAEKLKVRQVGSSYQKTKVVRYRGKKTIAPLKSFKVVRDFGPYIDPVYNIKIFNESLILSSKVKNSKVRNVLNGKVIFAQSTALLKNVVIVEHANSIHTIYAGLSQIAPTIKKGKRIKKGYTVGRIDDELVFQVTKKSYYINPKDLIVLR